MIHEGAFATFIGASAVTKSSFPDPTGELRETANLALETVKRRAEQRAMTGNTIQVLKQRLREQARDLNCAAQAYKATVQSLRELGVGEDVLAKLYVNLGATVGVGQWLEANEQIAEKKRLEKLKEEEEETDARRNSLPD